MIPGSLTQTAAAIFTLWFLGAVPPAALAHAILQPCSAAAGSQLDRASHYRGQPETCCSFDPELHLTSALVLIRLRSHGTRGQLTILPRTHWPLLAPVPTQHHSDL
jgi:hypothetical protein